MTNWLVSPIFNIGLYYDGQFHINYNVIDTHKSMLIQPFCNRIIDVLTPKNLRRENVGYNCSRFVTSPQPICEDDGQEACGYCCCDGGDLTCQNGTNILSDIDDLSADEIKNKLGLSIWSTSNSKPANTEISQTPYTDFGQIDAELDSGINSYESLSSKLEWKTAKIPSLKAIEKVVLKLNNLKSIKPLDLATVAYSAQLAYEQLDFNKLSDKDKMIANKRLKVIDSKLRDVLDGRIYNSIEELNTNSMESIDFVDSID